MTESDQTAAPRSFAQRHIYPNRYILLLTVIFVVLGIVYANTYFPKLTSLQATFGGIVIGLFGTLFAACHTQVWKD